MAPARDIFYYFTEQAIKLTLQWLTIHAICTVLTMKYHTRN